MAVDLTREGMSKSSPIEADSVSAQSAGCAEAPAFLSLRRFFDLLADPHRRYAIYFLRSAEGTAAIRPLVEHVAAWDADTTADALSDERYEAVYVAFVREHLPALRDAGVVAYDLRREHVRFTEPAMAVFGRFSVDGRG